MSAKSHPHRNEATDVSIEAAGYCIERHIARGGMGDLYQATQLSLDRRVALKVISSRLVDDDVFRERFRREVLLAASLEHPNILPVYQTGTLADGRLFLAMRLVDGPDLAGLIKVYGPLGAGQTIEILAQIGEALDAAHRRGLIHRDVKPANVLLERHGEAWHAYLTDFGLARSSELPSQTTAEGEISGTIDYVPPELITHGTVDQRADVYAFGCMLYESLTGHPPYRRDTISATLVAHVNAPVPLPSAIRPTLPRWLDVVVVRAMEKDERKRAWSSGALMRWASGQLAGETSAEQEESPRTGTSPALARCPACGHPNRFAGGFCRRCGAAMTAR